MASSSRSATTPTHFASACGTSTRSTNAGKPAKSYIRTGLDEATEAGADSRLTTDDPRSFTAAAGNRGLLRVQAGPWTTTAPLACEPPPPRHSAQKDDLMSDYPGSIGMVRASIDRVFLNCARYIHPHRQCRQLHHEIGGLSLMPSRKARDVATAIVHGSVRGEPIEEPA